MRKMHAKQLRATVASKGKTSYLVRMIAVLSPAKSLDFSPTPAGVPATIPEQLGHSTELIGVLRKLSVKEIGKLMDLSPKLAALNVERYHAWRPEFADGAAKQALLAFAGDVYRGFTLSEYTKADFLFAQKHLRILSGLHGLLRPLDLIHPYRLEMGTELKTKRGKNLYEFWGPMITEALDDALKHSGTDWLINLASDEYFAAVDPARLRGRVLTCVFKDEKAGKFKVISFFAKRARGMMADFIVRHRIKKPADLRGFTTAGYRIDPASSTEASFVFHRPDKEAARAAASRSEG
jgi:uncharacterized protein